MKCSAPGSYDLGQQFSTGVLQDFLEYAMPDYLVKGTNLFYLRLSQKMTTANTTVAIQCELPVLNHTHIGHIIELHFIGHIAK